VTDAPVEIVELMEQAVARRRSAMIGVAAIDSFEVAWLAAAGGDEDALFMAGSLSKTVTAAVALELVERQELDLDSAVGDQLISWRMPAEGSGTTLRDLLGHTSGANVPFYPGYPQSSDVPTLAQSLSGLEPATTQAVEMDPKFVGRFRYSGGGFTVVQQLIEDVSGVPFAQAAREAILDPAGMTRSTFLQPPAAPLRDSTARTDWRFYPECAAAGLWTSPGDLARFVSALQAAANGRGGSLTRHTGEAMTAPHITLPPRGQWTVLALLGLEPPLSHGLGLFVREQRFINLGGAAGFFSALAGSNEDGTGAVVMTSGCRPALVLRVLLELSDAQAWNGFRASRGAIKRRTSDLLLRVLS
jgi:CubicO group peptidase (beta-lactamase class C family)